MNCLVCGKRMKTAREDYVYMETPRVVLRGIEVTRCQCGEAEVAIPRTEELHGLIAKVLVRKPGRLAGEEVRVLRKFLGWSGVDFAERFGVDPATVSRWETGKQAMGPVADRFLRVCVMALSPTDDYGPDAISNTLLRIRDGDATPVSLTVQNRKHWQETDLAA